MKKKEGKKFQRKEYKRLIFSLGLISLSGGILFISSPPLKANEEIPQSVFTFKADVYQESFQIIKYRVKGKVFFQYPSKMYADLTMEKPQYSHLILIYTPDTLWEYDPEKNHATRTDLLELKKEFKGLIPFQLTAYLISPPSHPFLPKHRYETLNFKYLGKEFLNGENTLIFEAKEKTKRGKEVERVVIWVGEKDGLLRKREEYIQNKLDTREVFSNIQLNIPLPDSLFNFKPYKSTKVKDGTSNYRKKIMREERLKKLFRKRR